MINPVQTVGRLTRRHHKDEHNKTRAGPCSIIKPIAKLGESHLQPWLLELQEL